jgi:RHS repeat-associated protein
LEISFGLTGCFDLLLPNVSIDGLLYFTPNRIDSVSIVTDQYGVVVKRYKYKPYGEKLADKSYTATGYEDYLGKYLFTAQEFDSETGLYYYNARFYDPEVGRFITPDSLVPDPENTQHFNRYMYCSGNPVKYNDPTGHEGEDYSNYGFPDYSDKGILGALADAWKKISNFLCTPVAADKNPGLGNPDINNAGKKASPPATPENKSAPIAKGTDPGKSEEGKTKESVTEPLHDGKTTDNVADSGGGRDSGSINPYAYEAYPFQIAVDKNGKEPWADDHCDASAYNFAEEHGVKDKWNWNSNQLKVWEIANKYPDALNTSPEPGSQGYMFLDYQGDGKFEHIVYYENKNGVTSV